MIRRIIAVGLVLAAVGLLTLAHAATVDPTWIAGLYDNGDGDDSILTARSVVAEGRGSPPQPSRPLVSGVTVPALPGVRAPAPDALLNLQERAPPSA